MESNNRIKCKDTLLTVGELLEYIKMKIKEGKLSKVDYVFSSGSEGNMPIVAMDIVNNPQSLLFIEID